MNQWPWYLRLPAKAAVLAVTLFLVCFPDPARFVRHVRHWRDPNALVAPTSPALAPLLDEFRTANPTLPTSSDALRAVERFVLHRIPYEWDWNTWGSADYLPTLDEVLAKGREDCDGRAVVAASLLQAMGIRAELVSDFAHVWVKTDQGEALSAGGKPLVTSGTGVQVKQGAWRAVLSATGFGVAVFPLLRELIVVAVLWLLTARFRAGFPVLAATALLMLNGLLWLRFGGADHAKPILWAQYCGLANLVAALAILTVTARAVSSCAGRSSATSDSSEADILCGNKASR